MKAKILHVDINSYFATILQQENPFLRGKPVGVVKSEGRTCVIAASKEAKKFGVKTGCRVKEARALAPSIVLVPAEFDLYLNCTKKLKALFESITPDAEIFSLDEAFIPITNCSFLYSDPYKLAVRIQERVKKELGEWVTCNIGISYNRLLAKLGGEIAPKGTIFEITEENRDEILKSASFKDVCGVGFRLEERLKVLGVTNPYAINSLSDEDLEKNFGPFWSKELRRIGKGENSHILSLIDKESGGMKNVGRTITGYRLENSEEAIKRVLYNLMEEVTYKVRKMNMAGRYVSIFLQGDDKTWHAHRTLKYYIRHTNEMFGLTYHGLYKKWRRNFKVIRYGVMLGMLRNAKEVPLTLFPQWYKRERLYQAMDLIANKYGLFTLRSALLSKNAIIRPEVTGYLGDKKYQFMN
ncbi:hypothetical protein HY419_01490 [candidate division WWE3 bacterium]|nr:hypothetical protein [candidate division WWE3 bacterium]